MSVIDALSEGQLRVEEFRDELGKVRHVLDNTGDNQPPSDFSLGVIHTHIIHHRALQVGARQLGRLRNGRRDPSSSRRSSRRSPTSHAGDHRRCRRHHGGSSGHLSVASAVIGS